MIVNIFSGVPFTREYYRDWHLLKVCSAHMNSTTQQFLTGLLPKKENEVHYSVFELPKSNTHPDLFTEVYHVPCFLFSFPRTMKSALGKARHLLTSTSYLSENEPVKVTDCCLGEHTYLSQ